MGRKSELWKEGRERRREEDEKEAAKYRGREPWTK
jgi:hypothetical protein